MIAHDLRGDTEDINRAVAICYLKLHVWENYARDIYISIYIIIDKVERKSN